MSFVMASGVYFAQISFDYNLVNMSPLIIMAGVLSCEEKDPLMFAALGILTLGYGLPRWFFALWWPTPGFSVYLVIQVMGMGLMAFCVCRSVWISVPKKPQRAASVSGERETAHV